MFEYFRVFSKDKKKYDLNQFLVVVSNRFTHFYIFIMPSYVFLWNCCFPNDYHRPTQSLLPPIFLIPGNKKYYKTMLKLVYIHRETIHRNTCNTKSKNWNIFGIASQACRSEVSSEDISRTTCTVIPNLTQLFRLPTRNSCHYSKMDSGQSTTGVDTSFSQLFQVCCGYYQCLLGIAIAIPWFNALLGLLQFSTWWGNFCFWFGLIRVRPIGSLSIYKK